MTPSKAVASTSYALESSQEDFLSSTNEEELTIDWLANSLKDFTIFIAKNQQFIRSIAERCKSLNNSSKIEEVTEVSKIVHKHLNKCISRLAIHKDDFKREYSVWCNKYIDQHSDVEIEENQDAASSPKKEKVKDVNKAKKSKEDKKKSREEEKVKETRTEAGPSRKKSSTEKKAAEEQPIIQSSPSSPAPESPDQAESIPEINGENRQVVGESDEEDHYFDTNTLLMETPHSDDDSNESLSLPKSPKIAVVSAKNSNSTSDILAASMEVDDAPKSPVETSSKAGLAKKGHPDQDLASKSKNDSSSKSLGNKTVTPTQMVGKKPGPASKTGGSKASPARSEELTDSNSNGSVEDAAVSEVQKQKRSIAESQATQFTEEDDVIQLREKQALEELLKSSDDSDDAELFKTPKESKRAKKEPKKVFVPSNLDEFAHIAQLKQICVVKLTTGDTIEKLGKKKKEIKKRRDTDADIDK